MNPTIGSVCATLLAASVAGCLTNPNPPGEYVPDLSCSSIFGHGLQASGSIAFSDSIDVAPEDETLFIGSSSQLPAFAVIESGGPTCWDAVNSVRVSCSSAARIDRLSLGVFESYDTGTGLDVVLADQQAVDLSSYGATEFNQVNVSMPTGEMPPILSLPVPSGGGAYHIESLTVSAGGTVKLAPGDYWIGKLDLKGGNKIIVEGTGTVRLFVRDAVTLAASEINWSAAAVSLDEDPTRFIAYGYSQWLITQSKMAGYLYVNMLNTVVESDFVGSLSGYNISFMDSNIWEKTGVDLSNLIAANAFDGVCEQ